MGAKSSKSKGGTRKYGRNEVKCARYRREGRREKNKERKAIKEAKKRAKRLTGEHYASRKNGW